MASFGDDFLHMNVEGASTAVGLVLLSAEGRQKHPILSKMSPIEGIEWGAMGFAKEWDSVPNSLKRHIIAALRATGKGALIVTKIVAILA